MQWRQELKEAVNDELAARISAAPYEGDGEYYKEMKASRKGFFAGIRIMKRNAPHDGETPEAYIERLESKVRASGIDGLAFTNTLRRFAHMPIVFR